MRIFCANAFTGEDVTQVTKRMKKVVEALTQAGHDAYCPLFDPHKNALQEKNDIPAIFEYAFANILNRDALVTVVTSARRSEGLLMEIGVALAAKKPVYLFLHKSVEDTPSHVPKLAIKTFTWATDKELTQAVLSLQSTSEY